MDWQDYLSQLETLSARGEGIKAASLLRKIALKKIPRRLVASYASVARQIGLPEIAIRLLNPIIHPAEGATRGSENERAIYAASLVRIGAPGEALALLKPLRPSENPAVLLYRTHALVATWRYLETIPLMEAYLELVDAPEQRIIGELNLVAALIHEKRFDAATDGLARLRTETLKQGRKGFHGNSLVLSAQWAIGLKRWVEAARHLDDAQRCLQAKGGLDLFFVEKWRAFLGLAQSPDSHARKSVERVREAAGELGHWETVRDCDLALAIGLGDVRKLWHLYFGTPNEAFRKRIFSEFPRPISLPDSYDWFPDGGKAAKGFALLCDSEAAAKKLGLTDARVLWALASDFYRPQRVASLFAGAYADEFYNPANSPARIHQAIRHLRRALARAGIRITNAQSSYSLYRQTVCSIRIPRVKPTLHRSELLLKKLVARFPQGFSAAEAAAYLKLPRRTLGRLLEDATSTAHLTRTGNGPLTRYRLDSAI